MVDAFRSTLYFRQHLYCTVFDKSIVNAESLDGYNELSIEHKEAVKVRVDASRFEIDQDRVPVDPDELVFIIGGLITTN